MAVCFTVNAKFRAYNRAARFAPAHHHCKHYYTLQTFEILITEILGRIFTFEILVTEISDKIFIQDTKH
jgi:hypothetical protein